MAHDLGHEGPAALLPPTLNTLPEHLLQIIVERIYEDSQRFVPIDRREFLSIESFPSIQPDASTLSSFRLVCKHFSELGLPYQFSRVTTRLSRQGFERLDKISSCVRAAQCTRRFIYMVPYFFVEGHQRLADLFQRHRPRNITPNETNILYSRNEYQRALLNSRDDVSSLTRAFAAFTALQHVQLNPVLDTALGHLLDFLDSRGRQGEDLGHLVQLKWAPACKHGLHSLGQALVVSRSKCNKVSVPAMDQEAALLLCSNPIPHLSTFSHNLTSLILQFATADVQMLSQLAPYFRTFLSETMNLEAIHIGFPMVQPLDIRLEDVFHGIKWPKLRALGIQAWRLGQEEIIDIAQRHQNSLRGFRLREVLLKEGRWSEVLHLLRSEMVVLDWVSLRRIDYAGHFDDVQAGRGFEIGDEDDDDDPDHGAFGRMHIDASSSDEDDEEAGEHEAEDEVSLGTIDDLGSDNESSVSNGESDHNPVADQLDLPISSDDAAARPLEDLSASTNELGDDGIAVAGRQRTKAWKAWVTARSLN